MNVVLDCFKLSEISRQMKVEVGFLKNYMC